MASVLVWESSMRWNWIWLICRGRVGRVDVGDAGLDVVDLLGSEQARCVYRPSNKLRHVASNAKSLKSVRMLSGCCFLHRTPSERLTLFLSKGSYEYKEVVEQRSSTGGCHCISFDGMYGRCDPNSHGVCKISR